jgi:hypothetical protein
MIDDFDVRRVLNLKGHLPCRCFHSNSLFGSEENEKCLDNGQKFFDLKDYRLATGDPHASGMNTQRITGNPTTPELPETLAPNSVVSSLGRSICTNAQCLYVHPPISASQQRMFE